MAQFEDSLTVVYAETIQRINRDAEDPEADQFRFLLGATCITAIANNHFMMVNGVATVHQKYVCLETQNRETGERLKSRVLMHEQL